MLVPKLRFKREDGTDYPEWRHTCVGEVFDKVKDKNKGCSNTNVVTNSAEFGLISQRDFFDKDIAVEGKTDNYTIIKANDFVYNPRKSSFAPFGAFNGYTLTDDGIVSPLYFCLRMKNNEMSANFMLWYFKSSRWHRFIYENGEQGGARHDRVGVSEEMLKGIPIDKPCLEEQQKIADFLSTVDEVIAQSEAEVQNLEQQKKAAMQKIFSQEVRFKREDGTDYPEWEEKPIGMYAKIFDGVHQTPNYIESGIPFVSVEDIETLDNPTKYISVEDYERDFKTKPIKGDILMTRIGDVGRTAIVPCNGYAYYVSLALFKPFDFVNNNFLCQAMRSNFFQQELWEHTIHTAFPKKINVGDIQYCKIEIPADIEEQQKIADFLSSYDEAISYAKQELDKWKELKKGLLQQMFV